MTDNNVMTLQEFKDQEQYQTEQSLATVLGVTQSTVNRWLQREDIFVETSEKGWETVFKETVLKQRQRSKRKKK